MHKFADMMTAVVALEGRVAQAAAQARRADEPRVYEWRPSAAPELPAIWNWIHDGTYSNIDTARGDDVVIVTATIGVRPSDLGESMGQLVRLVDIFRETVDPALKQRPLDGAVRYAKRVVTRTNIEDFDGMPVMCMELLIRCELTGTIS